MCNLTFRNTNISKETKIEAHEKCFTMDEEKNLIYCIECEKRPGKIISFENTIKSQNQRLKHIFDVHSSYLPQTKKPTCEKNLKSTGQICGKKFMSEGHLMRHQETKTYINKHVLTTAEIKKINYAILKRQKIQVILLCGEIRNKNKY